MAVSRFEQRAMSPEYFQGFVVCVFDILLLVCLCYCAIAIGEAIRNFARFRFVVQRALSIIF
jgi:hypothetical protein